MELRTLISLCQNKKREGNIVKVKKLKTLFYIDACTV